MDVLINGIEADVCLVSGLGADHCLRVKEEHEDQVSIRNKMGERGDLPTDVLCSGP